MLNHLDGFIRRAALGRQLRERTERLHRAAFALCHSRALADDLVQETFARALRGIGQLRELAALDGWLYHILHNCWRDHCRRARHAEDIDALSEDAELATEPLGERHDTIARVRAAIAALPDGQREVLSLVDIAGFSYAEVALLLNIPTGTVTSRISRGREALRAELADLVGEPRDNVIRLRKVTA